MLMICVFAGALLAAGCGGSSGEQGNAREVSTGGKGAVEEVDWNYDGENDPAHWSELSPEFAACEEGEDQSPVDIPANIEGVEHTPVSFHYKTVPLDIINTGHTEEVEYGSDSYATIGGVRYYLSQFHFHTPSEHTVGNEQAAMEMHLVHENKDGGIAVIAVLIQEGRENERFARFWDKLPRKAGSERKDGDITLNAAELLPGEKEFYEYTGSLTTPPCTEGVKWYVFEKPIELSASQIERFREIMNGNNRPVQPLNGREIEEDVPKR